LGCKDSIATSVADVSRIEREAGWTPPAGVSLSRSLFIVG
jgi:hypothetical protein